MRMRLLLLLMPAAAGGGGGIDGFVGSTLERPFPSVSIITLREGKRSFIP